LSKPTITRIAAVTATYLVLLWGHVVFVSPAAFAAYMLVVVMVTVTVVTGMPTPRLATGRNAGSLAANRAKVNSMSLMKSTQRLDELQAELNSLEDQFATEMSGSACGDWQSDIGNTN
jgi:hypothetical protein